MPKKELKTHHSGLLLVENRVTPAKKCVRMSSEIHTCSHSQLIKVFLLLVIRCFTISFYSYELFASTLKSVFGKIIFFFLKKSLLSASNYCFYCLFLLPCRPPGKFEVRIYSPVPLPKSPIPKFYS